MPLNACLLWWGDRRDTTDIWADEMTSHETFPQNLLVKGSFLLLLLSCGGERIAVWRQTDIRNCLWGGATSKAGMCRVPSWWKSPGLISSPDPLSIPCEHPNLFFPACSPGLHGQKEDRTKLLTLPWLPTSIVKGNNQHKIQGVWKKRGNF